MASSRGRMKPGTILDRWSVHYMLFIFLFNAFLFLCCSSRDTITIDSPVVDGETLVSAGGIFELGFFSPDPFAGSYIGIWHRLDSTTVVWVANRDKPLSNSSVAVLAIKSGKLSITDTAGMSYWSRGPGSSVSPNITAQLLDSGNLVLKEVKEGNENETFIWQSFTEPTDTFLPGMNMDGNLQLVSWKDQYDPTPGDFTFKTNEEEKGYVILKNSDRYWTSNMFFPSDDKISVAISRPPFNSSQSKYFPGNNNTYQRLVMSSTGEIQNWSWDDKSLWILNSKEPRDGCSVYNACGDYGVCKLNLDSTPMCTCLAGFRPASTENWEAGDFSEGCTAEQNDCQKHIFLNYTRVRVGKTDLNKHVENEAICSKKCDCHCQAYSYEAPMKQFAERNKQRGSTDSRGTCRLWKGDLTNLQEDYSGGRNLSVRLTLSDKESTSKNCEVCAMMVVPYPLSSGPNCGDPMYSSFQCSASTSKLSFTTSSVKYQVSSIDPQTQTFTIQLKDICEARGSSYTISQLKQSLTSPFNMTRNYNAGTRMCVIDIGWDPPAEPTCTSALDCKDWPESSCNATRNEKGKCLCNTNLRWDPSSVNCTYSHLVGGTVSPEKKSNADPRTNKLILIVLISVIGVSALSCVAMVYMWRKYVRKSEDGAIQRNHVVRRFDSERHAKDLIGTSEFTEEDKKGIDVPFFEFESILAATNDFSKANKLGQGGYGPVYKGNFPGGQELAVKRLSSGSGQGLQEFKNEVVLIAKLQHRNLVKLWGYCVKGDEKILIYEYMPNRSLDAFIFDSKLAASLDWEMRYNIILGIARGLLYLHQDSRLRIIHRDMKTSNILLDGEMNPKISDFGLARIFGGKQNEANTNRVVGTYGYMAPEYALDGFFSVKSDVFSFGVVMLEIISGRRNTGFYRSQETLSLLGTAWQLWEEDDALKLMDQTLDQSCNRTEFVKCVHVGLLCVQEEATDRPDMATLMVMLGSESASLPSPKQPAFITRAGPSSSGIASSSNGSKTGTWSDLTSTYVEGR